MMKNANGQLKLKGFTFPIPASLPSVLPQRIHAVFCSADALEAQQMAVRYGHPVACENYTFVTIEE